MRWTESQSVLDLMEWLDGNSLRDRVLMVLGLGVLLFGLMYALVWRGALQNMEIQDAQIAQLLAELDQQSGLLLDKPKLTAQLETLQARLPELQRALPSGAEQANLLARLHELLQVKNTSLAQFTPQKPRNLEVMGVLPVRMDVGGQADLLAQIPNDIARLSRQVNIEEFEILHDAQQRRWRFQAVLLAYSQLYPDLPLNSEAPQ